MLLAAHVALRKESVDRNRPLIHHQLKCQKSLSARRAWIEIMLCLLFLVVAGSVALRKESVDRNDIWIATIDCVIDVALRKESVDRNLWC